MDGFVTIQELVTQFNLTDKVIRKRLTKLVAAHKLINGVDFVRDNYTGPTHFRWLVNPTTFMREAGLALAPVTSRQHPASSATHSVNPIGQPSKPMDNQGVAMDNKQDTQRSTTVNQGEPAGNKTATQPGDQEDKGPVPFSLWREILDIFKGQFGVKDSLLKDLMAQNTVLIELNKNLTVQTVQQGERIQELLKLPASTEIINAKSIKVDEARDATVNHAPVAGATDGEPKADESATKGSQGVTASVAQDQIVPGGGEAGLAA